MLSMQVTWPTVWAVTDTQLAMVLMVKLTELNEAVANTLVFFPSLSRQTQVQCGHVALWEALRCPYKH